MTNFKYKKVFFTKVPYFGYFSYKNLFRMYPAWGDDEFKKFSMARDIPVIIEYNNKEAIAIQTSSMGTIDRRFVQNQKNQHWCNEVLRLLSILTNYHHFEYIPNQAWFFDLNATSFSAKWGQTIAPNFDDKVFDNTLKMVKRESVDYYNKKIFIGDGGFSYPNNIEALLDIYLNLPESIKEALDKSARLFNQALELRDKQMPSMAIVAFISAIENIISHTHMGEPGDKCKCGEIKYGVTKKFKTYLKEFVVAESKTKRDKFIDKIYGLRSKIVHAGGLHIGDLDTNFWEEHDSTILLNDIEKTTRVSLVRWLATKANTPF